MRLRATGQLDVAEHWRAILARNSLNDLDEVMSVSGRRLSLHVGRCEVLLVDLDDGRKLYVKRDYHMCFKELMRDLMRLRIPRPPVIKEAQAIRTTLSLGIAAPELVAAGHRGWLLWQRAALVTAPLPGRPLASFLDGCTDQRVREEVLLNSGRIVATLQQARLSWPGLRVKHFYVQDDLSIGLLDLDFSWSPFWQVRWGNRKYLARFVRELRQASVTDEEVKVFHAAAAGQDLAPPSRPKLGSIKGVIE